MCITGIWKTVGVQSREKSRLPCNELGRGHESLIFPRSTQKGMGQEQGTEIVNKSIREQELIYEQSSRKE